MNWRHSNTSLYVRGAERKRRRLADQEEQEGATTGGQGCGNVVGAERPAVCRRAGSGTGKQIQRGRNTRRGQTTIGGGRETRHRGRGGKLITK